MCKSPNGLCISKSRHTSDLFLPLPLSVYESFVFAISGPTSTVFIFKTDQLMKIVNSKKSS